MEVRYLKLQVNDTDYDIEVLSDGRARVNGKEITFESSKDGDALLIGGEKYFLDFAQEGDQPFLIVNGMVYLVTKTDQAEGDAERELRAPMSGQVVEVAVAQGSEVKKGQLLLVLEAMKMENQIKALFKGRVAQIKTSKGEHVKLGDLLITFE